MLERADTREAIGLTRARPRSTRPGFSKHALRPATLVAWGALMLCLTTAPAPAATEIEAARVKEIAAELPPKPAGFGRPITDRAAWGKIAQAPAFASVVPQARKLSREPVPALPDELYLDFSKTGNRSRCERVLKGRQSRIVSFTLAECLEDRGRFLSPLTKTVEALCAEKTWT